MDYEKSDFTRNLLRKQQTSYKDNNLRIFIKLD
jgi:hypothetical protein